MTDSQSLQNILSEDAVHTPEEFVAKTPSNRPKYGPGNLLDEQVREQIQRREFRRIMFWAFFIFLIIQYVALAIFIAFLCLQNQIKDTQPMLCIIIPATLGETYAIIRTMVQFIFSPGNFKK